MLLVGFHSKNSAILKTHQVDEAAYHLPLFKVGLSIQCGRLNVTQAVRVTGAQQQNVCRQDLIAAQTDEVSDSNLLPVFLHILLFIPTDRNENIYKHNTHLIKYILF